LSRRGGCFFEEISFRQFRNTLGLALSIDSPPVALS
jgi:hypothetical protein